jgi:hypothetical protein
MQKYHLPEGGILEAIQTSRRMRQSAPAEENHQKVILFAFYFCKMNLVASEGLYISILPDIIASIFL